MKEIEMQHKLCLKITKKNMLCCETDILQSLAEGERTFGCLLH